MSRETGGTSADPIDLLEDSDVDERQAVHVHSKPGDDSLQVNRHGVAASDCEDDRNARVETNVSPPPPGTAQSTSSVAAEQEQPSQKHVSRLGGPRHFTPVRSIIDDTSLEEFHTPRDHMDLRDDADKGQDEQEKSNGTITSKNVNDGTIGEVTKEENGKYRDLSPEETNQGIIYGDKNDGSAMEEDTLKVPEAGSAASGSNPSQVPSEETNEELPTGVLADILISPYETAGNAELGEKVFDSFKENVAPISVPGTDSDSNEMDVNPKFTECYGEVMGRALFAARQGIAASKECFRPEWAQKNNILGLAPDMWVPKRHLLLCLYEDRFIEASEAALLKVARDLDCTKTVTDAMDYWRMEEDFLNLTCNKTFSYKPNEGVTVSDCLKCEIFVARAFAAFSVYRGKKNSTKTLAKKVRQALHIMNENIKVTKTAQKEIDKMKKEMEENKRKAAARMKSSVADGTRRPKPRPVKVGASRKRCAEGKSSGSNKATATNPGTGGNARNGVPKDNRSSRRASGGKTTQNQEARVESLMKLYSIVQDQHARLGQTVQLLQANIQIHRTMSRDEMREEMRAELEREMRDKGSSKSKSRKRSRRSK
ncbi:MAG: hypothetical protein SGILL_002103 [Bacillariaceae sp.]